MVGLNKVMIIGNVGTDPEMRYTPNGNPVTSFRIATNRVYTSSDGERHEETEWFTVVAWNQLAEQCNQYLNKGRRAYIEGRLRSRSWEGQDGQTRYRNEIIANRVLFLDRQSGGQYQDGEGEVEPDAKAVEPDAKAVKPDAKAVEPDAKAVKPDAKAVEPDELPF